MALRSFAKSLPLVVLGVMTVRADTPTPTPPPPQQQPATGAPAPVDVKLTAPEMSEKIGGIRTQVESDYQHVQHLATVARKQNDIIKLTCVDNKLVEIKAEMNLLDTSYAQFQAQVAAGSDTMRASYLSVDDFGTKIHALRGDADVCAGVPELTKQESGGSATHPEFPDDPTQFPSGNWSLEPPGYASPFN
jgi:hypothetical protein